MTTALVTDHVPVVLFLWVFGNQAGVPLPVVPAIVAAAALAHGAGDLAGIVALVVGAALCADLAWYGLGRWRGGRAVVWFGRFGWASRAVDRMASLSPIRRAVALAGARFLPEANPVAAGLAGASGATLGSYLLSGLGPALVWASTWTAIGHVLGAVTVRGEWMMLWIAIALAIGASNLLLAAVLAVPGRQARQEEELAREAATSSRSAA
jgi:membrane protein DedA with SNARE-associated domain